MKFISPIRINTAGTSEVAQRMHKIHQKAIYSIVITFVSFIAVATFSVSVKTTNKHKQTTYTKKESGFICKIVNASRKKHKKITLKTKKEIILNYF